MRVSQAPSESVEPEIGCVRRSTLKVLYVHLSRRDYFVRSGVRIVYVASGMRDLWKLPSPDRCSSFLVVPCAMMSSSETRDLAL
eukprot:5035385-Prymnesium_polylepis.2